MLHTFAAARGSVALATSREGDEREEGIEAHPTNRSGPRGTHALPDNECAAATRRTEKGLPFFVQAI